MHCTCTCTFGYRRRLVWKFRRPIFYRLVGADACDQEYIPPVQPVQRLIQLCVGSWSSVVGSSEVMRTLHTSERPVSRQGTVVFDPRVPATPRVPGPLRSVRYYDEKIRLRSTQTLCRARLRRCTLWGGGGGMYSWYDASHLWTCCIFTEYKPHWSIL